MKLVADMIWECDKIGSAAVARNTSPSLLGAIDIGDLPFLCSLLSTREHLLAMACSLERPEIRAEVRRRWTGDADMDLSAASGKDSTDPAYGLLSWGQRKISPQ